MAGEQQVDKMPKSVTSGEEEAGPSEAARQTPRRESPASPHESAVMRKARVDARGEIMTRSEVAELLRCSEPHVVALIEREHLPAFRLGKLWRFRRSEVLAWCQRRENGSRTA